jgi:hypothetical protein
MHYLIYKITHRDSGMYYIGAHETNDINDGYMGSGTALKLAQEHYGIENFDKEVLFDLSTQKEMYEKEKELVDHEDEMSYNLTEGGLGGWTYVNQKSTSEQKRLAGKKGNDALRKRLESEPEFKKQYAETSRRIMKRLWNEQPHLFDNFKSFRFDWTDKKHTETSKEKMSNTHKKNGDQVGTKNSQYGKMWITNGIKSTKIMKNEPIPETWRKGRIMPV